MRILYTLLFMLVFTDSFGKNKIYENLVTVNKCWTEQTDMGSLPVLATDNYSGYDWIKLHLSLVEQTLRNRSTEKLTPSQRNNRLKALNYLHEYWQQGNFPINDRYAFRTPIFIDEYDNFCAVGYLIKATGHENISRMIQAKSNLAYVRQMNYPELAQWAANYGFSTDELAWIQPGYPGGANRTADPIGKGTNGDVTELYVNKTGDKLYVGGSFTEVDSSISTSGIAYVTENSGVYTWHNLGSGVNGAVYAIQEFQGKLFVGGSFTNAGSTAVSNIAYWDGTNWHNAGCIYGTVKDLIVYNNELYAAGDFDVCAALAEVNLAKWDTTYNMWQQIPSLDGHVNTIEVHGSALLLGGRFVYMNDTVSVIRWTETNGFETYTNNIANLDVTDIGIFNDTVYAVGNRLSFTDTNLIYALRGDEWKPLSTKMTNTFSYKLFWMTSQSKGFNTFCVDNDTVMLGGDFVSYAMPGAEPYVMDLYANNIAIKFDIDSPVNKMAVFKNELIFGGKFITQGWGATYHTPLNHIGKKGYFNAASVLEITSKAQRIKIYPNPASPHTTIQIENNLSAKKCIIRNASGTVVKEYSQAQPITAITLPELAAGVYVIELNNDKGECGLQILTTQ